MNRDISDTGSLSSDNSETRRLSLYATLASVPRGKVVSYGHLAHLAGLGRAARWVGRELSRLPQGSKLPWHRVVGATGRLNLEAGTPSGMEQRARLREEGIALHNDRIDMLRHGWRPHDLSS